MGQNMKPYADLRGRIVKVCGTQAQLAMQLNITPATLSDKLSRKRTFDSDEIKAMCKILEIDNKDIGDYFFCDENYEIRSNEED